MAMAEQKDKKPKETKKPENKNNKTQKIKLPNNIIIEVRKPNLFTNIFFYLFLIFYCSKYLLFSKAYKSDYLTNIS